LSAGPPRTRFSIVNVSSQSSTVALSNHLVYSTSKAAVRRFEHSSVNTYAHTAAALLVLVVCLTLSVCFPPPPSLSLRSTLSPSTSPHTARPRDSYHGARAWKVWGPCQRCATYCR
jgi:short-subunit dehydrogenase